MIPRDDLEHLPGQSWCLEGNTALRLDEPETLWVVCSGTLALFATAVKDGVADGARRALGSVGPGAVLVGTASHPPEQASRLLAIALEDTQLVKLSPAWVVS